MCLLWFTCFWILSIVHIRTFFFKIIVRLRRHVMISAFRPKFKNMYKLSYQIPQNFTLLFSVGLKCDFASKFVWCRNVVWQVKSKMYSEYVWEEGVAEPIWEEVTEGWKIRNVKLHTLYYSPNRTKVTGSRWMKWIMY